MSETDRRAFPSPVPQPCNDCPWRKEADAGWLGPYTPREWIALVHSDSAIACHQTIMPESVKYGRGDWDHPAMRQCAGANMFRRNVGKEPKNPTINSMDPAPNVLESNDEFMDLHDPNRAFGHLMPGDLIDMLPRRSP